MDELVASLPASQQPGMMGFLPASTYELTVLDAILRGYVRELERTGRSADRERSLRAIGDSIANDNLTSVFKIVLAMVKPHTFIEKLPTLWSLYFADSDVTAEIVGDRGGTFTVRGVEVAFLAPIVCAWLEFGMRLIGAPQPHRCTEAQWDAGVIAPREARYSLRWG